MYLIAIFGKVWKIQKNSQIVKNRHDFLATSEGSGCIKIAVLIVLHYEWEIHIKVKIKVYYVPFFVC